MRLVQLSRKLALKPSDIQGFLANIYPGAEIGQNSRLTDEQVLQVVRHFDPTKEGTILNEAPVQEPVEPAAEVSIVEEPAQQPKSTEEAVVAVTAEAEPVEEAPLETTPEVIRVQKQELPGLRVLGKIELKEPKKKESTDGPVEPAESAEARPVRPARPARREQPQQRTWRNPLEVQRQREIEEREERRRQQLEQEKARKTQKYLKKVKSAPTKPVRRQEETVIESQVEVKPVPRTWLGKLARWLTT
jgi:hypothetical protein